MHNKWIDISYYTAPHNLSYTIMMALTLKMAEKEHMHHGATDALSYCINTFYAQDVSCCILGCMTILQRSQVSFIYFNVQNSNNNNAT